MHIYKLLNEIGIPEFGAWGRGPRAGMKSKSEFQLRTGE